MDARAPAVKIFRGLSETRVADRPCHLAVGMFDGVHRGHQAVIDGAVQAARRSSALAGVLTFWPHPSRLFRPDDPVRMIFSADERRALLARLGIDFIIEQPFTREFAAIAAEEFVDHLKQSLPRLDALFVGENWRFGRGRRGDVAQLVTFARAATVDVVSVPRLNFSGEPVSSTRIRVVLERGDVAAATDLLGFPYFATGAVVPGRRLGRTIGFPTLNLDWRPDLRPALGVYAVRTRAESGGDALPGVANYGVRPTVDGAGEPLLEVHLLGPSPFDVGDVLHVELLRHLRAEKKFASIDDLRAQIGHDRDAAQTFFESAN